MKNKLLKYLSGGYTILPDNTRVNSPMLVTPIKRKLKPGLARVHGAIITPKNETVRKDTKPLILKIKSLKKNKFIDLFTNATIGAAMAENPSIMTASGWKLKDGQWELKPDEDSKKLANNLAVISTFSPTHPGTAIGEAALKHTVGLYNNVLDLKALKSFMLRYGYTLILPRNSIVFNNKKLDLVFNHIVNLHNTFTRGVHVPGNLNTKEAKEIGKKYLTEIHHVKDPNRGGLLPNEEALYTSNSIGLSQIYTNGNGFIGILRRPIKTGFSTRRLFLQLNDFRFNPIPDNRYSITTDYPKDFPKWTNPINSTTITNSRRYMKRVPKYNLTPEYLYLVRANAGAYSIKNTNKTDDHFRHYLFIGNKGEQPLELIRMYPYKSNKLFKIDYDYTSTGLSHKK